MKGNRVNVTLREELFEKLVADAEYHGVPLATMVSIALNKYYSGYTVQVQQVQVQEPVKEEKEDNSYSSIDMDVEIDDLD